MHRHLVARGLGLLLFCQAARSQVIEFEQNGLKYQTLTKSSVTMMFAQLPARLHEYAILQVAISNGSEAPYVIRPEDFTYVRGDGGMVHAASSGSVISNLSQKGSSNDVVKLVGAYEAGIYGNPHLRSTHGYEERRQGVIAASSSKAKAAAIASALSLVQTRLPAGESTDGAVFFPTDGKPLSGGRLVVRTNTDVFEFKAD